MESVLVVAPDPSTPPFRRRAHFTGQVDFKIRGFPTRPARSAMSGLPKRGVVVRDDEWMKWSKGQSVQGH